MPGVAMVIDTLRSFVLASALLAGRIDGPEAVYLSRLEAEFQTRRFGEVEWAHPADKLGTASRACAAAFFVRSCPPKQ